MIGDWLAFKVASTIEVKSIEVLSLVDAKVYTSKNITEFKTYCSENNIIYDSNNFKVTQKQVLKNNYLNSAEFLLKKTVSDIKKATNCTKALIAMGGSNGNFRDNLPLLTKYKDRSTAIRPIGLKEVRDLIEQLFDVEFSNNCEADDVISWYQYFGYDNNKQIIACTEDKDARQTSGYLYNPRKNLLEFIDGLGSIELEVKVSSKNVKNYKCKGSGRMWLYYQIVCGDPVDTYNPFSKEFNITDYKFYNLFKDIKTDKEAWELIAKLFKSAYGNIDSWIDFKGDLNKGTWIDLLQAYVDTAFMQRWEGDRLDVPKVLTKFGII